jgi:hypothetical protein
MRLPLALLISVLLSSCLTRESWRHTMNGNVVGEPAPELTGTEWIQPASLRTPDLETAEWKVYAFFLPD